MQRTTMDLWVGLFVMAGIGALLILAFKVGNLGTYSADHSYVAQGKFRKYRRSESQGAGKKRRGRSGPSDGHPVRY